MIGLLSFERRNAIYDIIKKQGRADITELVNRFGVSAETVRKDLILLEGRGLVRRVHGGALRVGGAVPVLSLDQRSVLHRDKKQELCRYALSLIEEDDWLFLDAGSTTDELLPLLSERFKRLHIVTYHATLVNRLSSCPDFEIFVCGGRLEQAEEYFYGPLTEEALRSFRVAKAFICPSAFSLKVGATSNHFTCNVLMKAAADIADKVYLLADSEKLEKRGNFLLFEAEKVDGIVTDSALCDEIFELYRENGIKVVRG